MNPQRHAPSNFSFLLLNEDYSSSRFTIEPKTKAQKISGHRPKQRIALAFAALGG
jgi:hypothetical protein